MAECPASQMEHLSSSVLQMISHLAVPAPAMASEERFDQSLEGLQNVSYAVVIGAEGSDG